MAVSSSMGPIGGLMAAYHKNRLYLAFINSNSYNSVKYKLETHTLDDNLDDISQNVYNTHKDQEIYMQPAIATQYSDNKYLIPGCWKKKCGTAFLIFE